MSGTANLDSGGSIVWACLPRLDGDPVFSGLLSPVGDADRGASQTMRSYLRFIHNTHVRTPVGDLQPVYGVSGQPQLVEVTAPSLRGYRGTAVGIIISAMRLSRYWEDVV